MRNELRARPAAAARWAALAAALALALGAAACGGAHPRGKPGVLAPRGSAARTGIAWADLRAREPGLADYHVVAASSEGEWWGLGVRTAVEFLVRDGDVRAVRLRLPGGVGGPPPAPDWRLDLPPEAAPRWAAVRERSGGWQKARALAPFAPGAGTRWGWPGYGLRALVDHAGMLVGVEALVPTGEGWSPVYEEA
ncbi:MAG: hypothetical protein IMW98_06040, partial [Firmicutes bacterium]|nr:hypothetical protein [Bacillota bacterium]